MQPVHAVAARVSRYKIQDYTYLHFIDYTDFVIQDRCSCFIARAIIFIFIIRVIVIYLLLNYFLETEYP
jgi:hypothetical protein